jgi:3-hydroxyacyl-[acyl-carrier-protein] dehydratase
MDAGRILELLPFGQPFLLIDRLIDCTPHRRIVTSRQVTAGDPLLCEGGPAGPWFPSLLLLEGLGQSAALLYRLSYDEAAAGRLPLLGFLRAELHGSARPGHTLTFDVSAVKMTSSGGVFEGRARAGERLLAEAELAFAGRGGGVGEEERSR